MDEFDRAIMEALNEAVPSTMPLPDLADRLVVHTRRRKRKRNVLLALGLASAAMGAVLTTAVLDGAGASDESPREETLNDTVSSADNTSADASLATEAGVSTSENTGTTIQQQQQGETMVKSKMRKVSAVLAGTIALTSAKLTSASSDGYQFIISGYPANDVSHFADSEATALVTGTMTADCEGEELEARYRTWSDSPAIGLNSGKYYGFSITIK